MSSAVSMTSLLHVVGSHEARALQCGPGPSEYGRHGAMTGYNTKGNSVVDETSEDGEKRAHPVDGERAKAIPTPPTSSPDGSTDEASKCEFDISSPDIRLFAGRTYLADPHVRPLGFEEEQVDHLIERLEIDLEAALGRIKAKSQRKPWKESRLFIDIRMSGTLEQNSSKVKLKPCVWFFCGSKWCRKIVERDVKGLLWLRQYPTHYAIKGGPLLAVYAKQTDTDSETVKSALREGQYVAADDFNIEMASTNSSEFQGRGTSIPRGRNLSSPRYLGIAHHENNAQISNDLSVGQSGNPRDPRVFPTALDFGMLFYEHEVEQSARPQNSARQLRLLPCEFDRLGCGALFEGDEFTE